MNSNFVGQRKWIHIETQESNDPYCFQVSKCITRLQRQSQEVYREADGAVHYDQVIDECKKKQFDNTEYSSVEMKKDFVNAPQWLIEKMGISSGKCGGHSCTFQPKLYRKTPVPSSHPKDIQEVQSILHCKTMYCYQKVLQSMFVTSETDKDLGQ